ncbi:ribosome biogenesis GTPase YlqF [Halalkalibacillus halophilus]|uniref:ribosome biogenesis GTPase YlqF n=1 Tax=Halalkalibacillus halophilus TaxID=392827 RepID=UPI0003FCBE02|nr:ribosome biogenesis GTPase YlqF [Halalkalibacillus halophilus]
MAIQWYPGHMAKAKREVQEQLKKVDVVIELVDARAPESSQNPMLQEVIGDKRRIFVLMKRDLADEKKTQKWISFFEGQGHQAIAIDVNKKNDIQSFIQLTKQLSVKVNEKREEKGVNPRSIRAMVIGIPNVGKSTLINRLAKKKTAETGDKPGVTKKQQWIKVTNFFDLLDTPGILWPKFEDQEVGYKLAAIGTIKDQILHLDDIAIYVLNFFKNSYPSHLIDRYDLKMEEEDVVRWFDHIGKKRGCLIAGGEVDYEKVADLIIQDLRNGYLGKVTFD